MPILKCVNFFFKRIEWLGLERSGVATELNSWALHSQLCFCLLMCVCMFACVFLCALQGQFLLDTTDFHKMGQVVGSLSLKTVVVQEGGYGMEVLSGNVKAFLLGVQGLPLEK